MKKFKPIKFWMIKINKIQTLSNISVRRWHQLWINWSLILKLLSMKSTIWSLDRQTSLERYQSSLEPWVSMSQSLLSTFLQHPQISRVYRIAHYSTSMPQKTQSLLSIRPISLQTTRVWNGQILKIANTGSKLQQGSKEFQDRKKLGMMSLTMCHLTHMRPWRWRMSHHSSILTMLPISLRISPSIH